MLIKQVKLSKKSIKLSQVARFELVDQLVLAAVAFPINSAAAAACADCRVPSKCVDRASLHARSNMESKEQLLLQKKNQRTIGSRGKHLACANCQPQRQVNSVADADYKLRGAWFFLILISTYFLSFSSSFFSFLLTFLL